jgi:hypothetical protein
MQHKEVSARWSLALRNEMNECKEGEGACVSLQLAVETEETSTPFLSSSTSRHRSALQDSVLDGDGWSLMV